MLVVMSQEAYNRFAHEIKPEGLLIVEEDLVRVSNQNNDKKVYSIPATHFAEELGKRMVLNSVMVGFFTAVTRLSQCGRGTEGGGRFGSTEFPRTEPQGLRQGIRIRQHGAGWGSTQLGTGKR